ncbi:unnamed protein product [Chilo suppressalis]|uniref:V-type proton ATPase subunit S1/VOA1 transmembrane domain-containing protein n=1 Tax=Chilo suppressalis TaxID=168631 RepID=A0ABN8L8D8_CHISP|nr:unnamed protein product [Chilo suppressalis]
MLIIIIFLLSSYPFQPVLCDRDIIPVFLIDHSSVLDDVNIEPNPFSKISTAFFADIVHGVIKKSEVVIVFVEDQLSVEDISTKDALGTPYRNLQVGLIEKKVKYLPKVIDPYKLLNQVFQPHQFNVFHLSSGMNLKMLEGKFKHLYIFFRDGKNETRAEVLRRHDLIMREVYTVMKQLVNGPVFAFYTGKMNPVQREKVEFVPIAPLEETKFPGVMVVTDGALYRFVGVFASTFTRRAVFNQIPMVAEETSNSESLSTKMAYSDFDLQFNFLLREKDWLLDTVALLEGGEEVGRTTMSVGAPWHHAFYCGEPLVIINNRDGSSVTISEYKIQPRRHRRIGCQIGGRRDDMNAAVGARFLRSATTNIQGSAESMNRSNADKARRQSEDDPPSLDDTDYNFPPQETPPADTEITESTPTPVAKPENPSDEQECEDFGHTVSCGPYFSVGILSSLFVIGISLLILSFGVVALMSCKANDTYDDPHGKILVLGLER